MIYKSILSYSAVAGISLFMMSCGAGQQQKQQGPPPAVPVSVTESRAANAVYYDEYPGIVTALTVRTASTGKRLYYRHIF